MVEFKALVCEEDGEILLVLELWSFTCLPLLKVIALAFSLGLIVWNGSLYNPWDAFISLISLAIWLIYNFRLLMVAIDLTKSSNEGLWLLDRA